MKHPRICGVITRVDPESIALTAPQVDLFELRIDLVGADWTSVARSLTLPWIACNRRAEEGGRWPGSEAGRVEELKRALALGASIVDLELAMPDLDRAVAMVKEKAQCLISHHDLSGTPSMPHLREIVGRQLSYGADICKLVTTAHVFEDNLSLLELFNQFPGARLVAFAMGVPGIISRILCPMLGGEFAYAALAPGQESAEGQLTVAELVRLYGAITR